MSLTCRTVFAFTACLLSGAIAAQAPGTDPNRELVQVSTINALIKGVYEGETRIGDLQKLGGFGIGTLNHLDGEMVMMDGETYQVTGQGKVNRVSPETLTPFASVTRFSADRVLQSAEAQSFSSLQAMIDGTLPSKNFFYAVKVTGSFPSMKVRSVPRQEEPYRPLTEVVNEQKMFSFENTSGTLIGFRCPSYVQGVNVAGYHMHFLSADKTQGGHVLDFELTGGKVEIDRLSDFRMLLPSDEEFMEVDLSDKGEEAIHKVEKLGAEQK